MSLTTTLKDFDYDRSRGSFRSWLFKVTHNAVRMRRRRQQHLPAGSGDSGQHELLAQQPESDCAAEHWELNHQQTLFEWAARQVCAVCKTATWTAFWEVAMKGRSPVDVAAELDMSVGAVYVAKSRVLARMKQQIDAVERAGFELPETATFAK